MQRAAIFASGTPVAFETNGTVREARGFTSRIFIVDSPASSTHSMANLSNTSITLNTRGANHSYLFNSTSNSVPVHGSGSFNPVNAATSNSEMNAKLYAGGSDLHDKEGTECFFFFFYKVILQPKRNAKSQLYPI